MAMEEDGWDLQAVVRGCRGGAAKSTAADPFLFLPLPVKEEKEEEEELLDYLSEIFPVQKSGIQELEELCKPFFTKPLEPKQSLPLPLREQPSYLFPQQKNTQLQGPALCQTHRAKRRKNQQKKEVRQVPAGGMSSDMWAWRKYGQKPIKGSPYPRGYYRCSSSKGCMARKQVERSRADPETLIITYTGEHNHPIPAHRNSLAGCTRQKFPSSSSNAELASSKALSYGLSPTTPLASSVDDDLLFPSLQKVEEEEGDEDDNDDDDDEENLLFLGDVDLSDDFMFGDLEDSLSQSFLGNV